MSGMTIGLTMFAILMMLLVLLLECQCKYKSVVCKLANEMQMMQSL